MRHAASRGQRGWALVETAIATLLLGLMVVAVLTTARKATDDTRVQQSASDIERAENALLGYAKAHAGMPPPDQPAASPSRPGYIEGWLPAATIGIDGVAVRIRYVVAQSLTLPQAIYSADPAKLGEGAIEVRTAVNGLDFCATLMRRELAGDALPGGLRMGYALQQTTGKEDGSSSGLAQSWLGDTASGPLPAGTQLSTRTRGFGEMATGLDCFARFATLSRDVRATAVAIDLRRLADQDVALQQVKLDMGDDSRLNNELRMTGWGLGGLKLASDAVMEAVTMATSSEATVTGAVNVASLGLLVAGIGELLKVTGENIAGGAAAKRASEAAVASAKAFRDQLDQEVDRQRLRANQVQEKGLNQ